jgi:uncharacterized caspase-like protein
MVKAAKNWAEISNGSSIALFLYSGHGIGEGWNSLLVPVDATTAAHAVPARIFQDARQRKR